MKSLLFNCLVYGMLMYRCLASDFSVVIDASAPWGISFPKTPSVIEPVSECFMKDYANSLGLYSNQENIEYFAYPVGGKFTGEGLCISHNCINTDLEYKLNVFPNNHTFVLEVIPAVGSGMKVITGDYTNPFPPNKSWVSVGKCKDLMSVRNITESFKNCNDSFVNMENVTCYLPLNPNTIQLELNDTHLRFNSNLTGIFSYDGQRIQILHKFGGDVTGPYVGRSFTVFENNEVLQLVGALPANEPHKKDHTHSDDLDVLYILLAVLGVIFITFISLYIPYYFNRSRMPYYIVSESPETFINGNF